MKFSSVVQPTLRFRHWADKARVFNGSSAQRNNDHWRQRLTPPPAFVATKRGRRELFRLRLEGEAINKGEFQ